VENEGEPEGLEGDGIFVSVMTNSDGDIADELSARDEIGGVERLVDEPLSGLFEED
jgi:hypothetical protein